MWRTGVRFAICRRHRRRNAINHPHFMVLFFFYFVLLILNDFFLLQMDKLKCILIEILFVEYLKFHAFQFRNIFLGLNVLHVTLVYTFLVYLCILVCAKW